MSICTISQHHVIGLYDAIGFFCIIYHTYMQKPHLGIPTLQGLLNKENGIIYFAMPRVQVQPIASSLLEVDVPENGNVEALKQALFETWPY